MTTAPFIIISIGMKIEMKIKGRATGRSWDREERERDSREKRESVSDNRKPMTWRRDGSEKD